MQTKWAETRAYSIDMSALTAANDALFRSVDFAALGEAQQRMREVIDARVDFSSILWVNDGSGRADKDIE